MMNRPAGLKRLSFPWLVVLLVLSCSGTSRAGEFYYMMVFGSQQVPPSPKYCHTFATFVRATGQGPCAENYSLESCTISWMPQTLDIRLRALLPECGANLGLLATLQWALSTGQRISMWGPYLVEKDLFDRALSQFRLLECGQVRYKAIDSGFRSDVASNCIHAVSSIADGHRLRVISPSYGETASFYVTRKMEPWIIDCGHTHEWVAARLGLEGYPIIHRDLVNPRTSLFWGALDALSGGDRLGAGVTGERPRR